MSSHYGMTVEQYAAQIRGWAEFDKEWRRHKELAPVDPNAVFNFARVAATWERLRYDMHTKGASPGDRNRLDELTKKLQGLATQLGLNGRVDPDRWLPGDPGVLIALRGNALQPWHEFSAYKPRRDQ
ncbi:hypothetical protein [Mycobacterium sp.]|uniref:hypothetical protein n=1 Tax=Mycobacterium sp. TaxID=1785 RepID=UPI003BAFFF31